MFDPMFTVSCSTPWEFPAPRERVVRRVLDGCGPAFWGWPYIPELVQPVRLPRAGEAATQVWTMDVSALGPVAATQCGICGSPVAEAAEMHDEELELERALVAGTGYVAPILPRLELSPCGHGSITPRGPDVPVFTWAFLQAVPVEKSLPALVDWLTVWAAWYYRAAATGAWDVADFTRPPPLFDIDTTGPAVLRREWNDDDDT